LCDFYYEWIRRIFTERSENVKSRTELNPGTVSEIKYCSGKYRTDGHRIFSGGSALEQRGADMEPGVLNL